MKNIIAAILGLTGLAIVLTVHLFAQADVHLYGLPPEAVPATQEFVASSPALHIVGADSDSDNQRKRVVLDGLLLKANGGQWPFHGPQETGDCSAFTWAGAIEFDQASQIEAGANIEFKPVNRQWLYSGGRWQNGRQVVSGAGSVPSLQAEFVSTYGVLWQDESGAPPYSGTSSDRWGSKPPPVNEFPQTRDYKVTSVARISSAQDACNAINAGYPVAFGSMKWGTSDSSIRLVEGRNIARDTTNWPHAQIATGYDGTLTNGDRLFRITNSWGPNVHKPHSQMPGDRPGGYYITWDTMESICREGMAFAVSGTQGFPKRDFNLDWTVIGSSGPQPELQEQQIMSDPWISSDGINPDLQMPGYILGGVLMLAALVLALFRGNGLGRSATWAALLMAVLIPVSVHAQELKLDFSYLETSAMRPAAKSFARSTNDFHLDWSAVTTAANADDGSPDFTALTRAAVDMPLAVRETSRTVDQSLLLSTLKPQTVKFETHQGTAPAGWTYFWNDGTWRDTPQPGWSYPAAGVTSPPLQTSQVYCNGGQCYWINK